MLVIILVAGVALPAGLGLFARRRKALRPWPVRPGAIDRWLISEYRLSESERGRVKRLVLGRDPAELPVVRVAPREPGTRRPARPAFPPALVPAARALAEQVLADRVQQFRVSRRMGWLELAGSAAAAAYGLCVVATGWGGSHANGGLALAYAVLLGLGGAANAVIVPRPKGRSAPGTPW